MTQSQSIPFVSAIFITLNIMLGAGLFLNTTELAGRAGSLGFVAYLLIGILMLPLVLGMSKLVAIHPYGGFYSYGAQEIHPFVGFISAWTYFIGKLASSTLMIHTATLLFQTIIPSLAGIPSLLLDILLIIFFCMLNTLNVRIGTCIQYFFFGAKLIPVLAMISAVVYWLNPTYATTNLIWEGIPSTLPLVLYAIVGFEAACSLSSKIERADVNAPRVILYAYTVIVFLNSLYQWAAYAILGPQLITMKHFFEVFAALAYMISPWWSGYLQTLFYCAIAMSVLGAAYGILYSNLWNLYILAQHNYVWHAAIFTQLNGQNIPIACVLAEGLLCLMYILCSRGAQVPLQQITSFGIVLAYTISACALWFAIKRGAILLPRIISICALINCCMLSCICGLYLIRGGSITLWLFFALLLSGIGMAWSKRNTL
ncbi:MAG TPA: APC family permease [Candidatus Babeliales bacterium]|jgi:APA family basic amino acid/polyamine antiporter|nr:APC family permease [Candidatus Babeliales bacterium]